MPDLIGIRGDRIAVAGLTPVVVKTNAVSIPLALVRGKVVSVAAVDEAGNKGLPGTVRVSR